MSLRKGQKVTVKGGRKSITCELTDIDHRTNKIWIRLPTNQVLLMGWDAKQEAYTASLAGLDFSVDPKDN